MNFYDRLLHETEAARAEFLAIPFLRAGANGDVSREQYIAFLTQAYHHVKHTVPLLMACGARLPEHLGWLRTAVAEYIKEEIGHEEWILNDIGECGGDTQALGPSIPGLPAEIMVAYAYDTIARRNPVSFFGMVFVLEGTSVQLATQAAEALQAKLNLPKRAFSYLSSHGSLDMSHVDFFKNLVNRLEQEEDKTAILHAARVFYRLYGDVFRELSQLLDKE